MRRATRWLPTALALVLAGACADQEPANPTHLTAESMVPDGRPHRIRDRVPEVARLPPESLRAREREAVRQLLARARTAEEREAFRDLMDPSSPSVIYEIRGDSLSAELVSLVYAIRAVERGRRR